MKTKKFETDAKTVLKQLGQLSEFLKDLDADAPADECFSTPLEIIQGTMNFDVSVLYKVANVIDNVLILEVVKVLDGENHRMDLVEGRKIRIWLDARDRRYVNEVTAFVNKSVSFNNVPGMGCDIMGYVYVPRRFGGAYLFGGDFFGNESAVRDYEVSAVEIMCNFLSTILLKTRLACKAEKDDLTGLFNAGKIKEELGRLVNRFERKPKSLACIALGDIDFFKRVNDTHGHIQGDMVLREVGRILSESMRNYFDMAARYGGEEFLLIFDETDRATAYQIVERIRKTIEKSRFPKVDKSGRVLTDQFLKITMSFGVAALCTDSPRASVSDWISRADQNLYSAKQAGRNRTV